MNSGEGELKPGRSLLPFLILLAWVPPFQVLAGEGDVNPRAGKDLHYSAVTSADVTPPDLTILYPTSTERYVTYLPTIDLKGTASDNVGVKSVSWENWRRESGIAAGTTAWSVHGIELSNGGNVIIITAMDTAGNQTHKIFTVLRKKLR
jgi:hypothetical protein